MSDGKLFRSQIGGFNKEDVNNFIRDTDQKHTAELEELNARIAALTETNNELSVSNEEISVKLSSAESASAAVSEELRNAQSECERLMNELNEKEGVISGYRTRLLYHIAGKYARGKQTVDRAVFSVL